MDHSPPHPSNLTNSDGTTVKQYFLRRILISRFPYVENSLRYNLADFPVNFTKQFVAFGVSTKFYYRNSYCIIVYITYY